MRNYFLLVIILSFGITTTVEAQFSGGFIAGMNFSKFVGPLETDGQGNEVESFAYKTGFHVGGRFSYRFNDIFGLRSELLYSQKGTDYSFDGQSYWIFVDLVREQLLYSRGQRRTVRKTVTNYLEVPMMAYLRFGRLEISGGGYAAYLFRGTASGEVTFDGVSEGGNAIDPFTIAINLNYFTDGFERTDIGETQPVIVDGDIIEVPVSIGARYEELVKPSEGFLNRFDFGLIGGISVYLNRGLNLGFRVNYGLQDLTRNSTDVSKVRLDENNNFILRNDFDRNLTLQASIGFSF